MGDWDSPKKRRKTSASKIKRLKVPTASSKERAKKKGSRPADSEEETGNAKKILKKWGKGQKKQKVVASSNSTLHAFHFCLIFIYKFFVFPFNFLDCLYVNDAQIYQENI